MRVLNPLIDIFLNNSWIDKNNFMIENITIQAHGCSSCTCYY